MKRSHLTLLAALIAGSLMLPYAAEARNGRAAGAFVGGLAAGALIGGLMTAPAYAYPRYYSPYAYPAYAYPSYAYGPYGYYPPRCFRRVERHWNGYRWYRTRVLVCY